MACQKAHCPKRRILLILESITWFLRPLTHTLHHLYNCTGYLDCLLVLNLQHESMPWQRQGWRIGFDESDLR